MTKTPTNGSAVSLSPDFHVTSYCTVIVGSSGHVIWTYK